MSEGFTEDEANQIGFLMNHRCDGKLLGLAFGIFTVYSTRSIVSQLLRANYPRAYIMRTPHQIGQILTVIASYKVGDYLYTSRRYGANSKLTVGIPIISNRYYIDNKEALIQNFEPLNRKFTQDEIDMFLVNQKKDDKRKWIYNPYLTDMPEDEWRNKINFLYQQNKAPWDMPEIKQDIEKQNEEKVQRGEQIKIKPFKVTDFLDISGRKLGLQQSPFTVGWTVLE